MDARPWVVRYMEPYFMQKWTLFAPDPPLMNRRIDYQCELAGEAGPWKSRTNAMLETHARSRFGPVGRFRRHEQATMIAAVGSHDSVVEQLIAHEAQAPDSKREQLEDLLAQQNAARIQGSRVTYELMADYCREEQGDVDRVRFRVTTEAIAPYSHRNDPSWQPTPEVMLAEWLAPEEFDGLEAKAVEYIEAYRAGKREASAR
ncbi:DUF5819 family protein [Nannocystaceae bacterium ST9]